MAKRGETRPWRATFTWEGWKPVVQAFGSAEEAFAFAEQQARRVGPDGVRCTTVVTHRDHPGRSRTFKPVELAEDAP